MLPTMKCFWPGNFRRDAHIKNHQAQGSSGILPTTGICCTIHGL
jgi:hypothetical protein